MTDYTTKLSDAENKEVTFKVEKEYPELLHPSKRLAKVMVALPNNGEPAESTSIGEISYQSHHDHLEIHQINVHASAFKNLMTLLIEVVFRESYKEEKRKGALKVKLPVSTNNDDTTLIFYQELGFIKEEKAKPEAESDHSIMTMILGGEAIKKLIAKFNVTHRHSHHEHHHTSEGTTHTSNSTKKHHRRTLSGHRQHHEPDSATTTTDATSHSSIKTDELTTTPSDLEDLNAPASRLSVNIGSIIDAIGDFVLPASHTQTEGSHAPTAASSPASSAPSTPRAPAFPLTTVPAPAAGSSSGPTTPRTPSTAHAHSHKHVTIKPDTRTNEHDSQELSILKKQLDEANRDILIDRATLYFTNLQRSINRLDTYVDAYSNKSRSFLGLFGFSFLGLHGPEGRNRAKSHCNDWKQKRHAEISQPFYTKIINLLEDKSKSNEMKEVELNKLYITANAEITEKATNSFADLKGGNWNEHSYRSYLLAFANERKTFSDAIAKSPKLLNADITFGAIKNSKESELLIAKKKEVKTVRLAKV